ncbi:MAG TPA: hypothetical protein VEI06_06240 [Gemmatimonadaceae bacterium]|nr:hypothetical protein [Gemmatimonadaceae bacterium]
MSVADIVVIIVGTAAIAWVNWYFFVAGRSAGDAPDAHAGHHHH